MKKKSILAVIIAVLVICIVSIVIIVLVPKGNTSNVNRVVGYSALYGDESINKAFDVIEKKFADEFEGCELIELRYDDEVENKFAEAIQEYYENKQELIVVISSFRTDAKGGDGSLNPNETYENWQWHLVKTADKKSWEIIGWGY